MDSTTPVPIGTTNLAPGWTEGLDMREYLSDPAVSASKLWKIHSTTPSHLRAEIVGQTEDDQTPAKGLGTLTHAAVFEPGDFHERYVVMGTCDGHKKDGEPCTYQGSIYRDGQSFCKTHDPAKGQPMDPGIEAVSEVDRNRALAMKRSLLAHPLTSQMLTAPGPREATGVAQDPKTGLWCRIRPDLMIHAPEGVDEVLHWSSIDLKTEGRSAAPDEWEFPKRFRMMGHYFRAAFYRHVMRELWDVEPQNTFYPVVESFPPYEVIVYRLNEDWIDIADAEVRDALDILAGCVESGEWPGYAPYVHDLNAPEWQRKQVHDIDFLEVA